MSSILILSTNLWDYKELIGERKLIPTNRIDREYHLRRPSQMNGSTPFSSTNFMPLMARGSIPQCSITRGSLDRLNDLR